MTYRTLGSLLLIGLLGVPAVSAQTSIREKPSSDRLLFVDGKDIRDKPGGQRLLFIDGNDIRDKPGGDRLLFIDGNSIRKTPGGVRLLFMDGDTFRRRPGSPILLHAGHPDIRPSASGSRLYFIDGPQLSKQQLVAVLYHLKPDLFKLSAEEEAALKKEMDENRAESEREMKRDKAIGNFSIVVQSANWQSPHKGDVTVTKKGDLYCLKLKLASGAEWEGVATRQGDEMYAAIGPVGSCSLGVYEVKGTELEGVIYPCDGSANDPSQRGEEKLKAGKKRSDPYKILSGKAAVSGKSYTGSVQISQQAARLENQEPTFFLHWTVDKQKRYGVGIQLGQTLITCQGPTKELIIIRFQVKTDSNLVGSFFASNGASGYYHLLGANMAEAPKTGGDSKTADAGSKPNMPAAPPPAGTVAVDLSKANADYALTMFAPAGAKAVDGITGIEVKNSTNFQIEIGSAKNLASLKQEIEKNSLNKLKKFHVETEEVLLYETEVAGQAEFHFLANVKVGDKTYGVEDVKGPRYTKADVEMMVQCAKTMQAKK